MSSLEGRVAIVPENAISALEWVPSRLRSLTGEGSAAPFTVVDVWLTRINPSNRIVITFSPGIRGKSGRVLAEETRFELVVTGKGPPKMVLEGMGYENAGGKARTTSEADSERPPVFISGPATLRIDFLLPVETEEVGAAVVRRFTERGFTVDPAQWDTEGRSLTLPIQAMPRETQQSFSTSELAGVRSLPSESSSISWMVAHPLKVYRSRGMLAELDPVGAFHETILEIPAGPRALYGKRLLTFRYTGTAGDFDAFAPMLWELDKGRATRLMDDDVGIYLMAGWLPGGKEFLVSGPGQDLLHFAARTRKRRFSRGDVVGTALSPKGQVAVFTLDRPFSMGNPTGIELTILGSDGQVLQHVGRVSEVSKENEISMVNGIDADWSDDGTSLAFTRFERGEGKEPMQTRLSLWRAEMARPEELDVPAASVSWRRGTNQVLVASEEQVHEDRASLYDVQSHQFVREDLPGGALWSPDGRYLACNYGSYQNSHKARVYDLETGRQQRIRGYVFGWDLADGQLYWAGELAGSEEDDSP